MPKTFFTADTHFGHARIIPLCKRPHHDVEEMDRMLISDWNHVVRPEDTVWHLGDFAYRNKQEVASYFHRLPGTKHLVTGNHDSAATLALPWASVSQIAETVVDGTRIIMCHYPMLEWQGFHRGALHLFGHVHGSRQGEPGSLDVGVDACGYRPLTLDQIRRRMGMGRRP